MVVHSAGILLWRRDDAGGLEVLLGHPGGPFWARKDAGAWSVPKGEYVDEAPLGAAVREFTEELGVELPLRIEDLVELGEVRQPSGKRLRVWAGEADLDADAITPGTFSMEWPPKSGRTAEFPEIDRAAWWPVGLARERLLKGQLPFLDRLESLLDIRTAE